MIQFWLLRAKLKRGYFLNCLLCILLTSQVVFLASCSGGDEEESKCECIKVESTTPSDWVKEHDKFIKSIKKGCYSEDAKKTIVRKLYPYVRRLPASNVRKNFKGYDILHELEPGNKTFKKKREYYKSIVQLYDSDILFLVGAKETVRNALRDPYSARFRGLVYRVVRYKGIYIPVVCGEVNGKNAFGAYVGYKRFIVVGGNTIVGWEGETSGFYDLWNKLCVGK